MSTRASAAVDFDIEIGDLDLDCGETLRDVTQRVTRYGPQRTDGETILVTHALTGNSHAHEWWSAMVGPAKFIDTDRSTVFCVNALGSAYGSTGPTSIGPDGEPYGERFPVITVADIVRAQRRALRKLEIERLDLVIGGSLGGMQALAWGLTGARVAHAIVIGAYDYFSAMGIALNAIAREAIAIARTPELGIALARKIAMLTYKSEALFEARFSRRFDRGGGDPRRSADGRFDVEGYLDYQGRRFAERMDAASYRTLTRAMDLFDTRDTEIDGRALPTLTFVGITSDWLFSPHFVECAARRFERLGALSRYVEFASNHGHDAFLAEAATLATLLATYAGS